MSAFATSPRIHPFLWFDHQAEEAAAHYIALFPNSRQLGEMRNTGDVPHLAKGAVLVTNFELDGLYLTAMNGGPGHPLTDAVSLVVTCETQAEIDRYWEGLTADGGKGIACGWCRDKFGMHWQVVPRRIGEYVSASGGMRAMMGMMKLDIAALEAAARG